MKKQSIITLAIIAICLILGFTTQNIDLQLEQIIVANNLRTTYSTSDVDPQKVALGRLLFFDKILSGNKDVSCATCHHPNLASADALALSIGVGGTGLGQNRQKAQSRELIPRNSPDLFNRGTPDWHTMFWDSRVSGSVSDGFITPADEKLPDGLDNILAVQAMFPVLSRDEMRGEIGDIDVNGAVNELALIGNPFEDVIWHRIMQRILQIPKYQELFQAVYPEIAMEDLGFQHAANAIAAFEMTAFTYNDSPWDQYVAGDTLALSTLAKEGALLFYGKANCASCHSGPLFTDQKPHNIGIPQLGPGKGLARPLDLGIFLESGAPEDLFAFRTPALKNTALTGPWMHNGAYNSLEDVIQHHLNPQDMLNSYDCDQLEGELRKTCLEAKHVNERLIKHIDPQLKKDVELADQEIKALITFLEALTDTSAVNLEHLIPKSVPSRLPVID